MISVLFALVTWAQASAVASADVGLVHVPFADLKLDRSALPPVEDSAPIPVEGPFRLVGVVDGVRAYEAALPVRLRSLYFSTQPEGMRLRRGNNSFTYNADVADRDKGNTWELSPGAVTVRIKADAPPPQAGEFVLTWPTAQQRERNLKPGSTTLNDWDFVVRSLQIEDVTRYGVYLPAPAEAAWDVLLPAQARLRTDVGIIPPEAADGVRSDGATVEVLVDGAVVEELRVAPDGFAPLQIDLSAFAGKKVRLGLRTKDGDPARDYVFFGNPTLFTPTEKPKRIVLLFLDTVRQDHVGVYGAERETTPTIDALGQTGTIFEDARSVAPWTLPSTRALLTGRQPEFWSQALDAAATLPERLAAAGWATGAIVGNIYLSSNFDMSDGWGEHACVVTPRGETQVDRALDFLERHPEQNTLLMLHFMDAHLPYKEPLSYRNLFVTKNPDYLPEVFTRGPLLAANKGNREKEMKRYLEERYDQNIRYIDDQVARVLDAVGEDAWVVVFADHGEEFFDHGDLEHGHALYDELLRVPLIWRVPGFSPQRVDAPVSLIDVTPTLLALLGMDHSGLMGRSLVTLMKEGKDPSFDGRARAFGRPLYGFDVWGSERNGVKYISRSGVEQLYDIKADPGETKNLRKTMDPSPARQTMSEGLDRPVQTVLRLVPASSASSATVQLTVPGGIAEVWTGDDATNRTSIEIEREGDEQVTLRFSGSRGRQREAFVLPKAPLSEVLSTITARASSSVAPITLNAVPQVGNGEVLGTVQTGGATVTITYAVVPLPAGNVTVAMDPELLAALQAMGYMED